MKNNNSLIFKTRVVGVISAVLVVLLTLFVTIFFIFFDKRQEVLHVVTLQKELNKKLVSKEALYKKYNMSLLDGNKLVFIKENAQHMLKNKLIRDTFSYAKLGVYTYGGHYYYQVNVAGKQIYLKSDYEVSNYLLLIFIVLLFLVLVLYSLHRYIEGSLKPLSDFHKQVDEYGKSKKLVPLEFKNSDEISNLADAFYNSVAQVKSVQEENLQLLNGFVHNLKASLTKLLLKAHLLSCTQESQKETILVSIDELQKQIEEIKEYSNVMINMVTLEDEEYYLNSLIDEALYDVKLDIEYKFDKNSIIKTDKKVFVCILKILFSNTHSIEVKENSLKIFCHINNHDKMDFEIEVVKKIFTQLDKPIYVQKDMSEVLFEIKL